MLAVIRIRGNVNLRSGIKDTLVMLRLRRVNNCVLIKKTPQNDGMIMKVKDYVVWGEISDEMLKKLVSARGRLEGEKKVSEHELAGILEQIRKDKCAKNTKLKHVFRLSPPVKGHHGKSIKLAYPKGALGYRGGKINELLEKML
jgi:large subunit ribosomal protein L30